MRTLQVFCVLGALVISGCEFTSSMNEQATVENEALSLSKKDKSSSSTVVVTANDLATDKAAEQANPTSWFFYNDETDVIDNALGSFVTGPETPPAGAGSAEISVSGTQRRNLATYLFSGVELDEITTLAFSTYNPVAGNGGSSTRSAYLNFNVDFDGSDTWQRRLVFVPSQNGIVVQDTWQEWDAIDGGDALWTWSGYVASGNTWPDGDPNEYRTWSDVLASFPNIAVRTTDSWLGMRVGEPYASGYTENLDKFVFGTADGTTVYDFEPVIGPPTDKNECKKGGWQLFNNPSFPNQGQCIQHVNTGN